ncbi:MAG: SAM-dependent methyltransferase [Lachnospiraceae bacterium]|nr:SAM-dependent methyltransferase [Lachnospiraceae bacterium]MDY3223745.1 SAM-dependent methyltransferase [Lachnospiraceae bacterium]
MDEIRLLCKECIGEELYQIILSKAKGSKAITKVKIRPLLLKGRLMFQVSETKGTQIFHSNLNKEEVTERIIDYLNRDFSQAEFTSGKLWAMVLISKKGKITIKKKKQEMACQADLSHNKVKNYILPEGVPVPFLVDLGVQTIDGKTVRSRYDKFRQINRYLEFIADIMPILPTERRIRIVDFGCGKSYLTFALYYYMKILCKRDIQVVGLDLKEKVIEECNSLAQKYGYENLNFVCGDVVQYQALEAVDMVVTLHACDTATDYALKKAISWGAKVIFTVPCCQHEVNGQIKNELLQPLLKYGLLKERIAALVTDGIRANLLEEQGYQVQIMEFIDMEHTPKNILIRAVRESNPQKRVTNVGKMAQFLGVENTLQKLLKAEPTIDTGKM